MKKKDDLRQVLAFLSEDELEEQTGDPEEDLETEDGPGDPAEDPAEEEPTKRTTPRKRADGRPDRRYKKGALRGKATILMRPEELEALEDLAGREGQSLNQIMRNAIIEYLERRGYPGSVLREAFKDPEERS